MKINKIVLKQFRNYEQLELSLGPKINFLFGENGQGKTNLLEAIYLCTCARSHRTSKDADLKRKNSDFYEVSLYFEKQQTYEEQLKIRLDTKRSVFHDEMKLEKLGDMMGIFQSVIFAPEDIALVKEGPALRRRFMDLILSQTYPLYFSYLSKASHVLEQRNAFLKQLHEKYKGQGFDLSKETFIQEQSLMSIWDDQYAKVWVYVFLARYFLIKDLKVFAQSAYTTLSAYTEGQEHLDFHYEACQIKALSKVMDLNVLEHLDEKEPLTMIQKLERVPFELKSALYDFYTQKLEQNFIEDIRKKTSTYGFHRDEIEFYLNGENIKSFASQGQTRSIVLALKLAELQFIAKENKKRPVLLLDDVLSELDEYRRKALMSFIQDEQVIITCTDAKESMEHLKELQSRKESKFFKVKAATIEEVV